jgi:hypothetical protein
MKCAELEALGRIADSDNVWWLYLVRYVRDIAKWNTQRSKLNVPEPFIETLRTLKKFCLFYSNPSTRYFTISCAKLIPPTLFLLYSF